MKSGPHLPQLEKAVAQKQRPNTAKKKKKENQHIKKSRSEKNRTSLGPDGIVEQLNQHQQWRTSRFVFMWKNKPLFA